MVILTGELVAKYTNMLSSVFTTVTSHDIALPACQGISVLPSVRLPSTVTRPDGSLTACRRAEVRRKKNWTFERLRVYISHIWGEEPPERIDSKFFLAVGARDVITRLKFGHDRLRWLWSVEGKILPFPIDFDGRHYNTYCWHAIRVKNEKKILANSHETRHSISLISYAGCLGLSPVYFKENSL